ncbi:MAG: acyltransferase [Bacteroidales bacterium]|nr:acyltransferase [Bacteroidales bacterium]
MKLPLPEEIFAVTSAGLFEERALRIFNYQAAECRVYSEYIRLLGIHPDSVISLCSIPFMPVTFFRDHLVTSGEGEPEKIFHSSGTTGMRQSRHAVKRLSIYDESLERTFRIFYGDPSAYAIMGLLPSYLEREGSSLIYMVKRLMELSGNSSGGFFHGDHDGLLKSVDRARSAKKKVLLIGVSYALLDLAEEHPVDLSDVIIMETGGMKGRRREMIRDELHELIKGAFNLPTVHSEYGMTELLSQAYSKGAGLFNTPPWMRVLIRDSHDPSSHTTEAGSNGGISVIDLANIYSCSFIATSDLGRMHDHGAFEVLGRFDDADIRGCNLLVG